MPEKPRIGVVILSWNGGTLTIDCLESLRASRRKPERVVLVENASTDGSFPLYTGWADSNGVDYTAMSEGEEPPGAKRWLTIIRTKVNRGFAPGNNHAIRFLRERTDCTHVMLLNNDATVAPDFFDEIDRALTAVPDAGLVTGTIYEDHDDRSTVWYAGGIEIPFRALTAHLHAVPPSGDPVETEFISGCAMIISRAALDRVGNLAECYSPVYWEDAEYSLRVRASGLKLIYAPAAIVYHKVGATVGPAKASPLVTYCQNRHRVFFVRRNYHGAKKAVALAYLLATKPARALVEVLRGNARIGSAIFRGFANGLTSRAALAD